MHCPVCKDEFRPGFTRCASCGVDLVDTLPTEDPAPRRKAPPGPSGGPVQMTDYCGFVSLDEARDARDTLHVEGVRTEITIREAPDSDPHGPVREEYWLRVERTGYPRAMRLLGFDPAADHGDHADHADASGELEEFDCGACGKTVGGHETSCPHCGARFDDD
jgi:hypothetical protein